MNLKKLLKMALPFGLAAGIGGLLSKGLFGSPDSKLKAKGFQNKAKSFDRRWPVDRWFHHNEDLEEFDY